MDNIRFKDKKDSDELIRLNKYLSDAGVCSRREADRMVEQGRVTINGQIAVVGQKVTLMDQISVDGNLVGREEEQILIAFNKPVGVECTSDLSNPDNIIDFIGYSKRIYPIGRLDKNSQGLILLTNDGSLVNSILKGSNYHEKEYIVTVDKPITDEFVESMSRGVELTELEQTTRPCKITKINNHTFNIVLTQGLNRQIRRMCQALGYNVQKLKRIRIMNIELGNLQKGTYRDVTDKELEILLKCFN